MPGELTFDREQAEALIGARVQLRNGERHVITRLRSEDGDVFEMDGGVHGAGCLARKRTDTSSPYDIVQVVDAS